MKSGLKFAGSNSDYEDSEFVILGVPFDKTSSFRAGTRKGPEFIRKSSYCFEPYMMEYDVSLNDIDIHDMGDLQIKDPETPEEIGDEIKEKVDGILDDDKNPVVIGGEHSITPFVVESFKEYYPELEVLIIDAHLDYRDKYEGMKRSHATCSRRVSESVGLDDVKIIGVRSISIEESNEDEIPDHYTSHEILEDESAIQNIIDDAKFPLYLSIDMDGFDPSYAPGVGNPEPFGLTSNHVKRLISGLADKIVGFDVMETNPKYDTSEMTSNLASRLIYEYIGSKKKR